MGATHQAILMHSGGGGATPSAGGIVFLGSADIETTNGTSAKWPGSGSPPTVTTPSGVHDRCWDCGSSEPILDITGISTLSVGKRFQVRTDATDTLIRFINAGASHLEVNYVAGGAFQVRSGITELAISSSGLIAVNTWYYIEIAGVIHDTNGSFTCNLYSDAGSLIATLSASGVDTRNGATSTATSILLGASTADDYVEDIWVDSTGELYGREQVETLTANGAGDLTQLTRGGTDSGANWSQVNEKPAQVGGGGDDYVDSTGDDQFDCYTFTDRSVSGTPRAVGVAAVCQAISGSPQFKLFLRIAGVSHEGAITHTADATNRFYGEYWNNNPATGIAWTDTEINSLQAGIKWLDTQGRTRALFVPVLVQL